MRIDHVVYAAEPDGLVATAKRLGGQLGIEAVDGGLHPRFGTRNEIIPLEGRRFIEIVEPLDHPASDKAPFGQAVRARCEAGGGWLGWVVEVSDMASAERIVGREAVPGNRHRPNGTEITWRQLGVKGLMADPQVPFFIAYDSTDDHPSKDGPAHGHLTGLQIAGSPERVREWLGLTGAPGVDREDWESEVAFDFSCHKGTPGLLAATFSTREGDVTI